jgi:hypothetical protein
LNTFEALERIVQVLRACEEDLLVLQLREAIEH